MSLVEQLQVTCEKELDRISDEIYNAMYSAVAPHNRTGEALGSLGIQKTSEWSRFIGGESTHLYYLNSGRGEVVPKRRKALKYSDGTFHMYSSPYAGIHFVEKIASKYR